MPRRRPSLSVGTGVATLTSELVLLVDTPGPEGGLTCPVPLPGLGGFQPRLPNLSPSPFGRGLSGSGRLLGTAHPC
jgi:hypothetical protein